MATELRKLLSLAEPAERRRLAWLFFGMLVLGVFEALGVSSVLPFIAVLANPEMIRTNSALARLYQLGNFQSTQAFLISLGGIAIALTILVNSFSLFINWKIVQISNQLGHALSMRILNAYLAQPYTFYLGRLSTNLSLNATDEVTGVINGVTVPSLQLASRLIVAVFLSLLVFAVDPLLASTVALVLGGGYGMVFRFVRRSLFRLGQESQSATRSKFRGAMSLFQGIKDLKVLGRINHYVHTIEQASADMARKQSMHGVLLLLPRYAIETIAVIGMLAVAIYLLIREQDLGRALPMLALYAFAAYRLMPALQNIFASLAQIRFNLPSLDLLYNEMRVLPRSLQGPSVNGRAIAFKRKIELHDVTFTYPGSDIAVLDRLSLTIPRNSTIGIVGTTGAGKTTIVDLILGLLVPNSGELLVDETVVDATYVDSWRAKIGYVPQSVFLSEESVARNVAFGLAPEQIDMGRVRQAARVAKIDEFIERDLPQGYDTPIGERGIRLSGGQRQRIGIARALYADPEVLILDEATASLDSITEDAVIDAIRQLSHRKTIIAVAHRLTTLQDCDLIYMVSGGRISDAGVFEELLKRNMVFRAMAKAN